MQKLQSIIFFLLTLMSMYGVKYINKDDFDDGNVNCYKYEIFLSTLYKNMVSHQYVILNVL